MRRTLLLFILIFALAVGTPVHAATELPLLKAEVTSNVTWELQGTTLVFSGTGEIGETGGWEALRDTVTAIVIRSGITGIGARASSPSASFLCRKRWFPSAATPFPAVNPSRSLPCPGI